MFGPDIREASIRETADMLVSPGLKDHGYNLILRHLHRTPVQVLPRSLVLDIFPSATPAQRSLAMKEYP